MVFPKRSCSTNAVVAVVNLLFNFGVAWLLTLLSTSVWCVACGVWLVVCGAVVVYVGTRHEDNTAKLWWKSMWKDGGEEEFPGQHPPSCFYHE